jgi:hypothetical protein
MLHGTTAMPDKRPTEFADRLVFLSTVGCNYKDEYGRTAPTVFADAWKTLDYFIEHTPRKERNCCDNVFEPSTLLSNALNMVTIPRVPEP